MFDVEFVFPIEDNKRELVGLVGTLARDLPDVLRPRSGLTRFKPQHGALLTLEVFADDAAEALITAAGKVRLALELRGRSIPETFEVSVAVAEELILEDD